MCRNCASVAGHPFVLLKRSLCCVAFVKTPTGYIMFDVARHSNGEGSARRWRERRLRSWLRHERLAMVTAVAEATHHSSRKQRTVTAAYDAPR